MSETKRPRTRGCRGGRRRRKRFGGRPATVQETTSRHCRAYKCVADADPTNRLFCDPHFTVLPPRMRSDMLLAQTDVKWLAMRSLHECVEYIAQREHRADLYRLKKLHEKIESCYKPKAAELLAVAHA